MNDEAYMQLAMKQAERAQAHGEVPVGAIIVKDGDVIAEGFNRPIEHHDPTAHAEIVALRKAAQTLQNYRLTGTTLYVTLEPCAMCLGAIIQARISRLVFGAFDPRAGAVASVFEILSESRLNHRVDWTGGVMADECGDLLKQFFKARRG